MSTLKVKGISAPTGYDLAMPAGAVIQVVTSGAISDFSTTAHRAWTASNTTLAITPKFSSSKVFVVITQHVRLAGGSSYAQLRGGIRVVRGSTVIWNTGDDVESIQTRYSEASNEMDTILPASVLDSPATTSATTYTLEFLKYDGDTFYGFGSAKGTSITLMEVAG